MPLIIDEEQAAAQSRLTAIRMTLLTLRCMENWKQDVDDYDEAMILVAVVAITAERLTRSGLEPEMRDLGRPIPPERLARCNVSSIAAATGLNRETARRKVGALVARGLLVRSARGAIAFTPGLLQQDSTLELVRRQLDSVVRFANDLLRDGVLIHG
jgi:hypothetical protein